jgi:hypothetical protein
MAKESGTRQSHLAKLGSIEINLQQGSEAEIEPPQKSIQAFERKLAPETRINLHYSYYFD